MEYVVSLHINIEADSPVEAVQETIKWIMEDGADSWVYEVMADDGTNVEIDALHYRDKWRT